MELLVRGPVLALYDGIAGKSIGAQRARSRKRRITLTSFMDFISFTGMPMSLQENA
jgi:hypothetical protein